MSTARAMWVAVALASGLSSAMAAGDQAWPERIVSIDKMTFTQRPLRIEVPQPRAVDRSKTSTLVLHIHVDADGVPVQQRLEQSSGNPHLDEAVLHAVRVSRFKPYLEDGQAVPVTVVALMRFPFQEKPH